MATSLDQHRRWKLETCAKDHLLLYSIVVNEHLVPLGNPVGLCDLAALCMLGLCDLLPASLVKQRRGSTGQLTHSCGEGRNAIFRPLQIAGSAVYLYQQEGKEPLKYLCCLTTVEKK